MARKPKTLPGPSHLSKILANLNASPRLELSNVQSLKLTLASKNDHFGARHFLKEELPRIRWSNPSLNIEVEKVPKSIKEAWKPELQLRFTNGTDKTLDLQGKGSTTIVRELMDTAGAKSWFQWKEQGSSLLPGEDSESPVPQSPSTPSPLPSLHAFRQRQKQGNASASKGKSRPDPSAIPKPVSTQPTA
ncbi:hypothetical protein ONZ45_g17897 [Pleurotus djamor]|nr:hypothetical protein ONZ45_g17897 [Pleurotus djamor]